MCLCPVRKHYFTRKQTHVHHLISLAHSNPPLFKENVELLCKD
ncbi:HNH endonuclease [Anaerobacillus alkalidiazotrophicus]